MTAPNKEPRLLVMKKRTRTYKLIAPPPTPAFILGIFVIISSLEKKTLFNLTIYVLFSNGIFMLH